MPIYDSGSKHSSKSKRLLSQYVLLYFILDDIMCINDNTASNCNDFLPTPGQRYCTLNFSIMFFNTSVSPTLASLDEDLAEYRKLSVSAQGKKGVKQFNTKQLIE